MCELRHDNTKNLEPQAQSMYTNRKQDEFATGLFCISNQENLGAKHEEFMQTELSIFLTRKNDIFIDTSLEQALGWWKRNEKVFPNLAKAFLVVACIPASQVECERIISGAVILTRSQRNRSSSESLDPIAYLQRNLSTHMMNELNLNSCEDSNIRERTLKSIADADDNLINELETHFPNLIE